MSSNYDDDLLREAIINIKAGDFDLARRYLERVLGLADDPETRTRANYWLSQITSDPLEKRKILEEILAIDPFHPEANKELAILDGRIKPEELVDPDNLPGQMSSSQTGSADRFTCPNCGGRMVFDGGGRTLVCEFCARNQVLNIASPTAEQDFITAMATGKGHRMPVMINTFNCQGCGSQFILAAGQISVNCAFCGSSHVVRMTKELIEPDSIIPMGFDQTRTETLLTSWLENNRLKVDDRPQAPMGMYLPVWSFEMLGPVSWSGTLYRDRKRVPVSGEQNISFDKVCVPAVGRFSDLLSKTLPDYDFTVAQAYDPGYLAGWPAEVYELSLSDASLEAREQMAARVRTNIQADHGHINDLQYSTARLSILSFRLVLVPLWHYVYYFDDRNFQVAINGQTGRVYGKIHRHGIFGWLEDVFGT